MSELIHQRTPNCCAIATIAMATGRTYDEVLEVGLRTEAFVHGKGCSDEAKILRELGLKGGWGVPAEQADYIQRYRQSAIDAEYFRGWAWGRRAILSVPSLNKAGGWHSVFYDGRQLLDPNPPTRKRYERLEELKPREMFIFREAA